jgi:DNA sulfur modification protein DndB
MKDMGFLTLPGKERLIALDGQHRLLALKIAIKGFMGVPAGVKMTAAVNRLQPHPELANEEISVIFVEHTDTQKIRKIFNKINKYAKQTSRGDNIITSDDDVFAVISRRLITDGEPLAPINGIDLVNWKSNTLSLRSKQLTTLSALYTISDTLLKDNKYSFTQIADRMSFASLSYFSRYVTKHLGMSPTQYRQTLSPKIK